MVASKMYIPFAKFSTLTLTCSPLIMATSFWNTHLPCMLNILMLVVGGISLAVIVKYKVCFTGLVWGYIVTTELSVGTGGAIPSMLSIWCCVIWGIRL